ncbi:12724_t:CDS:10 [Funneliformis mosseae]|uniref:12724_t:CDS:1 n=1 Tax=Funneliformis mosseae TaxID=27381 RepID=A0A9N9CY55_FUNMO|nr:12724_t:CDS:10 [Funneliformis mosseae]
MQNNSKRTVTSTKEKNLRWMLNSPDPSPLAFFRFTFPMHRARAFEVYGRILESALNLCQDDVKERLQRANEKFNAEIQKDWELWLEERKAILVSRSIQNTNMAVQNRFNIRIKNQGTLATTQTTFNNSTILDLDDEEEEEKCADEKEEFSVNNHKDEDKDEADKDEDDKDDVDIDEDDKDEDSGSFATMNDDILVPDEDFKFVERHEPETIGRTKRWILSSGTDVGQVLTSYLYLIPESQKCVNPVYWGILDLTGTHSETKQLFSTEDWTEMLKSFEDEIETIEEDIPDVVYLFFDEIEQIIKNNEKSEDIVTEIDGISSQKIEAKHEITLGEQDKAYMNEIKRAVLTYAENLADVDLPISETAFDNSFTNMLTRRFLDKTELKMDSGEICSWASARRRNEEAITGLRSGGLPEPHRKKIFSDFLDLSITMRDILHAFFNSNANASDEDLHKIFVLGVQSWGWTHQILAMDCKGTNICRYGKLCTTTLPNSIRTLACLEKFYVEMKNVKSTLNSICNKANDIALSHARAHRRKRKEKDREEHSNIEVGGCFGKITGTPLSKKSRIFKHGFLI